MKYLLILFFLVPATIVFSQDGDKIIGQWLNEEKDAKIEISKSGNEFSGKLIWGKDLLLADGSLRKDDKNSDAELKKRTLQNLVILKNIKFDGKEWTGGTIYDPKSGNTYSSTLKLNGNSLQIRGYKGISLLGRTTTWTKAEQ